MEAVSGFKRAVTGGAMAVLFLWTQAGGQVPNTISYQGILAEPGEPPTIVEDGEYDLKFQLYTQESGGSALWVEDHLNVPVFEGRFHVILGSVTSLDTIPFDEQYWLGITVEPPRDELPRMKLASSAYSLQARSVAADAVDSTEISPGGISFSDIGQNGADSGQVMKWNGSAWTSADEEGVGTDEDWTLTGNVLFTHDPWGVARSGNVLHGAYDSTHVNLGASCTTGTAGTDWKYATVSGGSENTAGGHGATVAGGYYNNANGEGATVSGGVNNDAGGTRGFVGGGYLNRAYGSHAIVTGGWDNLAEGSLATIAGGRSNSISGKSASILGGSSNTASGDSSCIGGGSWNTASGTWSTVGGGQLNEASGSSATVGGGYDNTASGYQSTIVGGGRNNAEGAFSLAAGYRAKSLHDGSFVWADSSDADFASTDTNQFLIRAGGGVGIGTDAPDAALHVVGDIHCTGKLTSEGGSDPPYVLYDSETRQAIIDRVAEEVPAEKQDGAVLFWNAEELRMEVYLPTRGEFRDLIGNVLASVPPSNASR